MLLSSQGEEEEWLHNPPPEIIWFRKLISATLLLTIGVTSKVWSVLGLWLEGEFFAFLNLLYTTCTVTNTRQVCLRFAGEHCDNQIPSGTWLQNYLSPPSVPFMLTATSTNLQNIGDGQEKQCRCAAKHGCGLEVLIVPVWPLVASVCPHTLTQPQYNFLRCHPCMHVSLLRVCTFGALEASGLVTVQEKMACISN